MKITAPDGCFSEGEGRGRVSNPGIFGMSFMTKVPVGSENGNRHFLAPSQPENFAAPQDTGYIRLPSWRPVLEIGVTSLRPGAGHLRDAVTIQNLVRASFFACT